MDFDLDILMYARAERLFSHSPGLSPLEKLGEHTFVLAQLSQQCICIGAWLGMVYLMG